MWPTAFLFLHNVAALLVVARVLIRPRMEPSVRLAWIMVVEAIPIVGIGAYLLFGEVRMRQAEVQKMADVRDRLTGLAQRLDNGRERVLSDARRKTAEGRDRLVPLMERLNAAFARGVTRRQDALERLDRMRVSLGYRQTLARGFAVIHDDKGHVLTSAEAAAKARKLLIEFADGEVPVRPDSDPQGSLF